MLSLNDRKWRSFSIKDIFITEKDGKQVPTGAYINKSELKSGAIPRITVTSLNNGIDSFCVSDDNNFRTFHNFISVSFLGTIFYHPYIASIDMKVHSLKLKNRKLNTFLSMFLITELKKSIESASYGDQLSSTDLPNKKMILPVDANNEPDYDFMEQFIKERECEKRKVYNKYLQTRRDGL